jgi:SAM-dependent methyltransferase
MRRPRPQTGLTAPPPPLSVSIDRTPPVKSMSAPVCRACHATCTDTFTATERMLGLGDEFTYGRCAACGSLSLADAPADLARFYPAANYYSFNGSKAHGPVSFRDKICNRHLAMAGIRALNTKLIRELCPDPASRILDVGSGSGRKLETLWDAGYQNLCGIDPFLPDGQEREKPFPLKRCSVANAGPDWDLIMYHHVLEHVPDPGEELAQAVKNLRPGGRLFIRIPVADSWAFSHYGRNWVQLDAPRHLCLLTRKAMVALAARHGLKTERLYDDSTAFQLWASRVYSKTNRSFMVGDNAYVRSGRDMLRWFPALASQTLFANWLNLIRRGDQSCFVFRKA